MEFKGAGGRRPEADTPYSTTSANAIPRVTSGDDERGEKSCATSVADCAQIGKRKRLVVRIIDYGRVPMWA
jgi:hypothetical protein